MSDYTDSELESVKPSHVSAHKNSSVAHKTKEKRKRDHTCQATPKCGFLRRKRQIIFQILSFLNGSFPAICFECSMNG